jgi:hypothetical protein
LSATLIEKNLASAENLYMIELIYKLECHKYMKEL